MTQAPEKNEAISWYCQTSFFHKVNVSLQSATVPAILKN